MLFGLFVGVCAHDAFFFLLSCSFAFAAFSMARIHVVRCAGESGPACLYLAVIVCDPWPGSAYVRCLFFVFVFFCVSNTSLFFTDTFALAPFKMAQV